MLLEWKGGISATDNSPKAPVTPDTSNDSGTLSEDESALTDGSTLSQELATVQANNPHYSPPRVPKYAQVYEQPCKSYSLCSLLVHLHSFLYSGR